MVNYNKQFINNDDVTSVIEALKNDLITTGPKFNEFEIELSKFTSYNYVSVLSYSEGLDAGSFARTPEQLKNILGVEDYNYDCCFNSNKDK